MSDSFFSPEWPNVAHLKPRLRSHLKLHRQVYRGRVWHIIEDQTTGRHHRLDAFAYELAGRLDGRSSIDDLWEQLVDRLKADAPSQHDVIALIGSLHQADLIQSELSPDTEELFYRSQTRKKQQRQTLINPFAFRTRLFDPTRLLDKYEPKTRWVFHWLTGLLFFLLLVPTVLLGIQHWNEIAVHAVSRLPSSQFWLLAWFIYPLIKFCHELAHALAVRHWGGKVQEMGVSLLVLMPVPYVNASAANLFPDKHARMIVSAAGIMVEVFFTSVALLLWINLGDGLLRDAAFVVMTISGISTVLFNANPLVKFDGYHFLADWLEIPDLAKRSGRYWSWLGKHYLLKVPRLESMDIAPGETKWLMLYAPASWAYRWMILVVIVAWMSSVSLLLAIAAALWFLNALLVTPAVKIVKYLWQSADLSGQRLRSIVTSSLLILTLVIAVGIVPAPFATVAQGVVWAPDESRVRAAAAGFVDAVLVSQNELVSPGQPLIKLQNQHLLTHKKQLKAQLAAVDARLNASWQTDRSKADQLKHQFKTLRAELERVTEQIQALVIRSNTDGRVIIPQLSHLAGRYIRQGDALGHVLGQSETRLRAAVRQHDAKLLSQLEGSVSVKFNHQSDRILAARILQSQPSASYQLPSPALGFPAGGTFLTDPSDQEGLTTLQPFFLVDLVLPNYPVQQIGNRVWVRFDHGYKPILQQWAIQWKQLLMQHFSSQA